MAISIVCSQVAGGSSHDIRTRRQESRCLAGYTSIIIVITVTTVIIIVPTFFTTISPQLLVIVSDGRGIFHESSSGARRPASSWPMGDEGTWLRNIIVTEVKQQTQ